MRAYYVPGSVPNTEYMAVNKADIAPFLVELID